MATVAGSIKSLSNGVFHAKDENGNIRVLKEGDLVYENDTIYGDNGNSSSSKIEIQLSGNDVIVLNEGQKQLIDSSLIETAFGKEELFFTRENLDLKADEHNSDTNVVSDLRDAEFKAENNKDITEEDTAEGKEEVEDETTATGEFQARDGNATDIISDLRNAQFRARTQVFEDKSAFETESKDRLSSLENTDRPDYTNPSFPSITTPPPPTPPLVVTPSIVTSTLIIGKLSIDDTSAYESEGFLIFTVSLDRSVASPVTFNYTTSPITAISNGVDYNDIYGKITIPAGSTSVIIKVPITDDYLSDSGETMKITISNVVGNAEIAKPEGIGTILDNPVNNPENGTIGIPTEDGGYGEEDSVYAIITGNITVNEGNTTTYTVKLVDKDGNEVKVTNATTVTVKYTNVTTQDVDTEYNNNNTLSVTIPANGSSNTFTVESIDDYLVDNGEKYNVAITKVDTNEFENVVIGDKNGNNKYVTTEILDNSNPNDSTPYNPNNPTNHNQESDKEIILIKLFAADKDGNVIKDVSGNYLLANEAEEGTNANYIAYAFENGTTTFNDSTKLDVQTGVVDISFHNNTAFGATTKTLTDGTQDFNNSAKTSVTIGQSFSTEIFKDLVNESTENYTVTIDNNSYNGNYESVNIDTNPVTTTIHDEKLFVKIEAIDNEAFEGENLTYKISIVNKDGDLVEVPAGKSIDVELIYNKNSTDTATQGIDYDNTLHHTITINGGTSETIITIPTIDDYYAEGDEGLTITIGTITNTGNAFENIASHTVTNGAPSDKITTTGIIKDNPSKINQPDTSVTPDEPTNGNYGEEDTVYAIITGPAAVNEGDTTTSYTVKLVDKNGNLVTVTEATDITITYTNNTTQNGDTQYNNENTITVTIPANGSSNTFTVDTIDDPYKDDGEKFKLTITDIENTGEFENVKIGDKNGDYKDVTTTIHDNTNTGTEPDVDPVKIVLVAVTSLTTTIADITNPDGTLIIDNTNETPEGGNLYYIVVAVDNDGKPLATQGGTVTINYGITTDASDKDATAGVDYNNTSTVTTTIGTVFSVNAKDDYYAEGDENFTVKITNLTGSPYESPSIDTSNDTVTSTIKDNPAKVEQPDTGTGNDNPTTGNYGKDDTVYVKITQTPSTVEGGNLVHTVTLVDKDGNPVTVPVGQTVTVNLTYTVNSGDFTESDLSTIVKSITIVGGTNHTDFTNVTKDDFTSEGDEVYNVTISSVTQSGAFENVAIKADEKTTTGTIKDGVTLGIPVDTTVYEDGLNTSVTSENSLTNSLGITNPNSDTYTVSFDKTITTSTNTSNGKAITYSYNTNGTILTATRAGDNKIVFTVELKKDGSGNDVYDFKLIEPMDHAYGNNGKNQFDMPFEFNITSNGTTSTNQTFNVTVVDSVPSATPIIVTTKEDTAITIRLADDDFKVGETVTINGTAHNIGTSGIAIYEQGDTTKQIGTLTINSNGTVTFTPVTDYSNYDTTKSPQFSYTVKDFDGDEATSTVTIDVKPVADTISITTSTPTMIEDDGNTKEGTNQVGLGLTKPTLSKDQTDKNFTTGDHPERNGEITLTFTNGDKVTGAKIFKADGTTQVGSDITTSNQTLKIVIVTVSGDSSTIDYTYHHSDITALNPSGAIYLTISEYENLKIQHAEDNDTDIKINISVTSYEVNDSDKPLSTTDSDLYETTSKSMTVKIHPATDDISLNWDIATGGTISQVDNTGTGGNNNLSNTFTFTSKNEGEYFTTPIDLQSILTKTSGAGTDIKPDIDDSEKRTYTISGIPEGTIINLGGQTAVANASGIATIVFNDTNNKLSDPTFSMKLPEQYSGTVNGKITLSVQDKGVDSGDTVGVIKTAEVYFNVEINPVADIATLQVSQAVGFEDAGRSGGNTIAKDGTINTNGTGGIPLNIRISSDDKDGSETFNVKISAIPTDAVIYYDGNVVTQSPAGTITIVNFDNTKSLIFIPPHNSDTDYILKVNAQTVDGTDTSAWLTSDKDINVIVKNIADAPVGTELNSNINVNEDNQLNLQSIYTTPANLASYDASEELTVKIELPTGFTIDSGSPFYIENGMYVVKASDIKAGNIKINIPENFSGSSSFDITYVTTEKAAEGDSKTWNTQTVNIFVNPVADDVTVATSSTIFEDADGSANKINITPTLKDTDGSETITTVKILASSVPAGYELFLGSANGTSLSSKLVGLYYELTPAEADSIYAKNTTQHAVSGNFDLTVVYTVKDTATGTADVLSDFTHTHTVNVHAVTDAPTLTLGTITQESGNVTISGSNITIINENSEFKVPVITASNDQDSSEIVTKIVISGVPMGVEVVGGTYYGYSGSEHNGIWVISNPTDNTLDANGAFQNIVFKVNEGADFEERDITITTYTKDIDAEVKSASQTIHINDFDGPSSAPGTPPLFDLSTKIATIYEDNNDKVGVIDGTDIYNLGKSIDVTNNGGSSSGNYAITLTDFPEGTTISGYDYSYEQGGKTYYVLVGTGNAADVETKLSTVILTPPTDMNTGGNKDGKMTFSATISTYDGGTFVSGQGINYEENILAVTDEMTISINANNINEDGTSNLSITLSNPNDGNKTELIGNTITVKVTENWADVATGGGIKGTLIDSSGKYDIIDNGNGTYTITPKSGQPAFTVDTPITGLVYTPASNRDGNVTFEVSVQNKETGSSVTLNSTGTSTISVTPVIDVVINASIVTATGTEDVAVTVGGTTLANPVKLEITAGTFSDGSEKLGNIILDEVPNGFTVWYKDINGDLVMATNIGQSGSNTFDLTPNIISDTDVTRNKWLIPASANGTMPEVYINAPENWSGDFDFKAKFVVSEQNLSTSTPIEVDVTGHINAVADGVTIDPTMTFGDAFSWVSLNLNANMKDIDGSETMSLELTGLDESAQFRLNDGTALTAVYESNTWKINGITFNQINNIQFSHDKSVSNVGVIAKTVDNDGTDISVSTTVTDSFELKLSDLTGDFKLDKGVSLDFNKIGDIANSVTTLKGINSIDLSEEGSNKLLNLSLQDVLDMSGSSKEIKIKGTSEDEVSFSGANWSKISGTGSDSGFDIYSNSNDTSVKVKVEQNINDHII